MQQGFDYWQSMLQFRVGYEASKEDKLMSKLPEGNVTYLFTDIENSTVLWEKHRDTMPAALAAHDKILDQSIKSHNGSVVKTKGDGFCAAFASAPDALRSTLDIQRQLRDEKWDSSLGELRVRMGLHTGPAEIRDGDYFGTHLNRVARLEAAGHGGQILISLVTRELVREDLPADVTLKDLGEYTFKNLERPEQVFQVSVPDLRIDFPALRTPSQLRVVLPSQQTSFVGREKELEEVDALLRNPDSRLITFLGPGGIGKTRLAIESARNSAEVFDDGVYFISMVGDTKTDVLSTKLCDVLQFTPDPHLGDSLTQLMEYLSKRNCLFVIDNMEQLVDDVSLIAQILESTNHISLIITSRVSLNIQSEWVYTVPSLLDPSSSDDLSENSAVELFESRARQVDPTFEISDELRPDVSDICQIVGGFPLAIELSAAWISMLSIKEILAEIEKSLDFLASTKSDATRDHSSMRAVFNNSWNLLSESQQIGFGASAIFRAGFTRAAASEIAELGLPQLLQLVNMSLVLRNERGRFEIHELIRQFAEERLQENGEHFTAVVQRRDNYFADLLISKKSELFGGKMFEILDLIKPEFENIKASVFGLMRDNETERVRDAYEVLNKFFYTSSWHIGRGFFRECAEFYGSSESNSLIPASDSELLIAITSVYQSNFAGNLGLTDEAEAFAKPFIQLIEQKGRPIEYGMCLLDLGIVATYQGDFEEAKKRFAACLEIADEDTQVYAANYLLWQGWIYYELGDYESAKSMFDQSYRLIKKENNQFALPYALSKLGTASDALRDHRQAMLFHKEAEELFSQRGDMPGMALTYSRMALSCHRMGDFDLAEDYGNRGLEIFNDVGNSWGSLITDCRLGFIKIAQGQYDQAKERLFPIVERAMEHQQTPLALYALAGIGTLFVDQGRVVDGAKILSFVANNPKAPALYQAVAQEKLDTIEGLDQTALAEYKESAKNLDLESVIASVFDTVNLSG
jgi:predicted ATPase/class 3 adenylate cyclase